MTGLAAIIGMNLARFDKWWSAGGMTAHAVRSDRGLWWWRDVACNRTRMVVGVGVEVQSMTFDTGATRTQIDGGVAVGASTEVAVQRIMTGSAGGLMDSCNSIAAVAAHANGGLFN